MEVRQSKKVRNRQKRSNNFNSKRLFIFYEISNNSA